MPEKKKVLIVGSGLAAYGACLALIKRNDVEIDLCDIGLKKPYKGQPEVSLPNAKDHNSSFYAYGLNDNRWNINLISKRMCSSHAYGGFSKVWSGSFLRPRDEDLTDWPADSIPSDEDYRSIIRTIKVSYQPDELNEVFPISGKIMHKEPQKKIYLGKSRIALNIHKKRGESRTATPFDTSIIFSEWIKKGFINYYGDTRLINVKKVEQFLEAHMEVSGKKKIIKYEKIFIGAGCINTTAIVDRSLYKFGTREYSIKLVPHLVQGLIKLSFSKSNNNHLFNAEDNYGFPTYFLEHRNKSTGYFWSHTQIGQINDFVFRKIFSKKLEFMFPLISKMISIFNFSLTVFNSNLRKDSKMKISISKSKGIITQSILINEEEYKCDNKMYLTTKLALLSKFLKLRLIPIPFSFLISKIFLKNSLGVWHFGGTLPMKKNSKIKTCCNSSGELLGQKGLFIIDTSSFPSIPGSTIGMLTMANAYRIAKKAIV